MQSITPLPLSEAQVEQAGALLARAFHINPLLVHMSPEEGERERISPAFFSASVRYGYLAREVWTTEAVDGVAIWLPPDAVETDSSLMDQAGITALPLAIGARPFARVMRKGYCPELVWSLCHYADTLRERDGEGDRAKAVSLLDESLQISRELGLRPLTNRALSRRDIHQT